MLGLVASTAVDQLDAVRQRWAEAGGPQAVAEVAAGLADTARAAANTIVPGRRPPTRHP